MSFNSKSKYGMPLASLIMGMFAVQAMAAPIPQKLLDQIDGSSPLSEFKAKITSNRTDKSALGVDKSINREGKVGVLGQGFDTFRELQRGYCLTGQEKDIPSNTWADISIDGSYTHERLVRDISRSVNGNFSYASFSVGASSEFSRNTVENEKSLVFIYKNRFLQPVKKFTNFSLDFRGPGQEPFAVGDWEEFRKRCGDRFLEELQIGGGLYYSIKLVFSSLRDKQTVKQKVSGSFGSFSASGSFKKIIDLTRINGQIVIQAMQSGGDVTGLAQMMLDSNGSADAVVRCNFNDMAACQQFISNMISYAGDTFPQQLRQPGQIPNVLNYGYLDYATLGVPDLLPPPAGLSNDFANDPVWKKRRELAEMVTKMTSEIDHAIALESLYGSKTDTTNQGIVSKIRTNKLEKNYEMVKVAGASCWHYPQTCINTDTNMRLNLIPVSQVDLSWLEYPNYLTERYFSFSGAARAYYTSGNGDYCAVYDDLKLKYINGRASYKLDAYPKGKYYPVLSGSDRKILQNEMDNVADCVRPTEEIYRTTIIKPGSGLYSGVRLHPYGCKKTTITVRLPWGRRIISRPGPLSCQSVLTNLGTKNINKNCSSGEIGLPTLRGTKGWLNRLIAIRDTSNTVRCL